MVIKKIFSGKFKPTPKNIVLIGGLGLIIVLVLYGLISVVGIYRITSAGERQAATENPGKYGLSYQEVSFQSPAKDHLTLRGWWIPQATINRTLILVPGQGGNRQEYLSIAKPLWEAGYSLLLFDLRGRGQSGGTINTYGQYEQYDLVGAVNFVKTVGAKTGSIGAIGHSMGGAVVIMGMSQTKDLQAVVSDSGFANWVKRTQSRLGLFYPGVALAGKILLDFDFEQIQPIDSLKYLGNREMMVIHGDQDKVVPVVDAYTFKQLANNNVELWIVPGAGHVEAYDRQPAEYLSRVLAFFGRTLS